MEQKVNINSAVAATSVSGRASAGRRSKQAAVRGKRVPAQASDRLIMRLAVAGAFLAPSVDGRDAWMIGVSAARRTSGGADRGGAALETGAASRRASLSGASLSGASSSGVSLGGGIVSAAEVGAMVSAGILEQDAETGRRRLVLSAAGRARAVRAANPDAPWLAQHAELGDEERRVDGDVQKVRINHSESPLAWLRRRRDRSGEAMIDEAAFAAGERLRADMTRAQMGPRVTASWEEPSSSGSGGRAMAEPGDLSVAARQRVRRALTAVGDEFAGVLMDVCGFLKGLEQVEAERGWPARSGKLILRMGLARLARHYGLTSGGASPGGDVKCLPQKCASRQTQIVWREAIGFYSDLAAVLCSRECAGGVCLDAVYHGVQAV